jgi:hypothetical protein
VSISRPLLRVALSCQAIDLSRLTPGSPRSHLDLISSQVGVGEVGSLLSLTWVTHMMHNAISNSKKEIMFCSLSCSIPFEPRIWMVLRDNVANRVEHLWYVHDLLLRLRNYQMAVKWMRRADSRLVWAGRRALFAG